MWPASVHASCDLRYSGKTLASFYPNRINCDVLRSMATWRLKGMPWEVRVN
jgi:hypothetical protein